MRIACDVCRTAPAAVICCADEAALCAQCDVEVHAANKLAGKHRRLPLNCDTTKLPRCDICQDKAALIFCVEDRALFCQDCDEAIHIAGTFPANHQRLLATGIRVGMSSTQNMESNKHHSEPPNGHSMVQTFKKNPAEKQTSSASIPPTWAVDDFLHFSDYESGYRKESSVGFGELSWFADISFPPEGVSEGSLTLAEVPEMLFKQPSNETFYRLPKSSIPYNNPSSRPGMLEDEDFFTVPDLG